MIELVDTNASAIAAEFVRNRTQSGSPVMGMVLTMIVVVPEEHAVRAMKAAQEASHEHPARVLGVILGDGRGAAQVDAQVGIGSGWSGETALIRLKGEVVKHAESVVLPLLLPDSPVAIWWPIDPPADPAADPLGSLAQRRITDSALVTHGHTTALMRQCAAYTKGNTDLAWTRTTLWRALLAAALDQHPTKVSQVVVEAEKVSPSADLLSAWLGHRLRADVERRTSDGPGITEVVLTGKDGDISIRRTDGKLATVSSPGAPDRPMALARRAVPVLLAEELRRLDEDDIYAETAAQLLKAKPRKSGAKAR
ncbi:glucose-6-phosphate dehydrogenase assembly protein OpcA [Nocardioides houyundeii]|uniref:glucose-6-phosphate dehydrogenase assembly protein OpcA n=1 Tax=Nocardioides houyundeii TaxID=2045452 RepID=UPI000C75C887|nr:glucose-6-phosphate dehydrogenase assembly protein OpcA [Nocardioides houyundeii]